MIEIDFPPPDGCQLKLTVKGHSGSENSGRDVVCASVSALLQTFVVGVETEVDGKVFGTYESGNCDLIIKVPDEKQSLFKSVSEIFRFGFRKIAESYPEHVEVNITQEGDYYGS